MTSMDAPRGDESPAPARDSAPGNTSHDSTALAPDASGGDAGDAHADANLAGVEAGALRSIKAPALADVLAYTNRDVVYRFKKAYSLSWEEAEDIFEQVKKWLWLANHRRRSGFDKGLGIDLSLVVIDEMWHNFVLFTKEYTQFCMEYFGYYLHHGPATEAEEQEHRQRMQSLERIDRIQAVKDSKRPQYEYIYDQLGEETFVKWYMEYPKLYSYRRLAELQLKAVDENLARVPGRPLHANPGTNHL